MSSNNQNNVSGAKTTNQLGKRQQNRERILAVVAGGICIALSFVLSQLKLFEMPMGGSVTPAATLPLILYCFAFGPAWGFGVCFVYSMLQLIGGYLLFPLQVMLDYILAYTCVGVATFASPAKSIRQANTSIIGRLRQIKFLPATIWAFVGFVLRLLCSVLSGVIFYAEYAGDQNVWVYSITYNGGFMLPEAIITLIMMYIVLVALGAWRKKKA